MYNSASIHASTSLKESDYHATKMDSSSLNNAVDNAVATGNNNEMVDYALSSSIIKGYQARSQVPIPIEYANFVELAEFADAVTMVRAHRQNVHVMEQQQQQQQQHYGRRLDESNQEVVDNEEHLPEEAMNDENNNEDKMDENDITNEDEEEVNEEVPVEENNQENGEANEEVPIQENNLENEEVNEMNNAIEESWEQAIQTNPELEQQQLHAEEEQSNLLKVNHVPFFWHIPRTGGTTLSTLLATCHSLVQATSSFSSPPVFTRGQDEAFASRFRDPTLYVVRTNGQQFVNVDLDSMEGVERAVNGKLIENELANVVSVPDVRLGSLLFGDGQNHWSAAQDNNDGGEREGQQQQQQKEYKGVLFAMFRHPIDRAVSVFYHKQSVKDSVHYDPSLEIYSLADWINSPSYITDYMVRTLVGKIDTWAAHPDVGLPSGLFRPPVPLTHDDLDMAKEILRRKCVIGLLEEKGESMKRFEKIFGWNADVSRDSLFIFEDEQTAHAVQAARWKNVKDEECRDRLLHWNWANKNKHPMLEEGSVAYNLLESKNRYDIELYMYAVQLFEEQYRQLGFDEAS
mmetsp:Transcript_33314/g.70084  ORF Transcript_33314/g.70084 Transcript_33314/m.70084 type:complete len:574 (-) Transcript_33314:448-2169(-)